MNSAAKMRPISSHAMGSSARDWPASIGVDERLGAIHQLTDEPVHVPMGGAFEHIDSRRRGLRPLAQEREETRAIGAAKPGIVNTGHKPQKQAKALEPQ